MGISAIRLLARKWSNADRPGYNPQQHHAQVVTMRSMVTGMMSTLNTASHDAHYSSDSDSQASINNEKATLQTMKNSLDKLSTTTATPTAEPTDYPTAAPTDNDNHCVRIVTGTGGSDGGDLSLEVRIADGNALDHANEAWPAGFCLSNGNDQNSGGIKLDGGNYEGNTKEAQCLAQCKEHSADWTGCEVIWDQGNAGCYVHTEHVNSANSVDRHKCLLRGVYDAATASADDEDEAPPTEAVGTALSAFVKHATGQECGTGGEHTSETNLGQAENIEDCASKCAAQVGCNYFAIGTQEKLNRCYWEHDVACSDPAQNVDDSYDVWVKSSYPDIPIHDEDEDDRNALDRGTEAWPPGFCLSNGNDQNSGVTKLDEGNYEGNTKEAQCLAQCKEHSADWTGCEVIWDQGNAGCYVHTEHVNSANY